MVGREWGTAEYIYKTCDKNQRTSVVLVWSFGICKIGCTLLIFHYFAEGVGSFVILSSDTPRGSSVSIGLRVKADQTISSSHARVRDI